MTNFKDSGLKPEIVNAVHELGFTEPTPIQSQILAVLQDLPESLVALAQTGTGKTAGFGLPIIHHVDTKSRDVQVIILCPTRELCLQITGDLKNFAKYMDHVYITPVYGGAPIHTQQRQLSKGAQIVVGTPGRVVDMLSRGYLNLDSTQLVVLDEADEMLNMGFKEDLETVFNQTPEGRSVWLFSATMPPKVESIAKRHMKDPYRISIGKRNQGADNVSHEFYTVNARDKFEALGRLLDLYEGMYGVVFCRTRDETNAVAAKLNGLGYPAEALNGSLTQIQRDKVMGRFRKKEITILVATDVAARGIDVDELTHVVNYGLPDDPEVYVHRSGRTGRAGKSGVCVSIIQGREKGKVSDIEKMTGKKLELKKVPSVMEVGSASVLRLAEDISNAELKGQSVSKILTDVYMKFEDMSREEIIEQIVKYGYSKVLIGKENDKDINITSKRDEKRSSKDRDRGDRGRDRKDRNGSYERRERDEEGKFTRLDINLGSKQRMNPARLMGIINEVMDNSGVNFGKIEINTHSSAIDVDTRYAMEVHDSLMGVQFGSKKINVELSAKALGRSSRPPKQGSGHSKKYKSSNSRKPKSKGKSRRRF